MRIFVVSVLLLSGLPLLGFGIAIAYAPLPVLAMADVPATGAAGAVELRAFYAGTALAIAALILICTAKPERRRDGLWLTFLVYAGIGLMRLAGMIVDDVATPFLRIVLGVELGIAAAAALALYRTRHVQQR